MANSINVIVGNEYRFEFTEGYSKLNGNYRITHIVDYNTLQLDQYDLFKNLYQLVDKTQNDLNTDLADTEAGNLRSQSFLIIRDLDSATEFENTVEVVMPFSYISGIPDPSIRRICNLALVADIGPVINEDRLIAVSNEIIDSLTTRMGLFYVPEGSENTEPVHIPASDVNLTPVAYSFSYLTTSEIAEVERVREDLRNNNPLINYIDENRKLTEVNSALTAQVEALKQIINNINNQNN